MEKKIEQVCAAVLKRVTPEAKERREIEHLAEELEKQVAGAAEKSGVKAKVRVEGSVAKDTWLSGEPDVDVFMRVPTDMPRSMLGKTCLKIARKATRGARQVERFAEHPYLEAFVDDIRVNIVPCYDVKHREWLSATDRTPFHTDYVRKRLNEGMRRGVRLLKKFMKGIGVYGAEIKVGGFSGYLCELLILQYKSFVGALKAFASYKQRIVVDIEDYYSEREHELRLLFSEPLVIVDPVDKGRNVASAVRAQKLHTFIVAARAFLKNPSLDFFNPPETIPLAVSKLKNALKKQGSAMVFVVFGKVEAVPDILWGQLYKSQRSLRKLLALNDFPVLRDVAWSDEKALNLFLFELEQQCVSSVKRHLGPPLERESECENFVKKHLDGLGTVSGPFIEDGRWIAMIRRKYTDVVVLLEEKLRDGGKNAGIAEGISRKLKKGFKVLANDEIVETYEKNSEFAMFLTEFLSGKPRWLEAVQTKNQ